MSFRAAALLAALAALVACRGDLESPDPERRAAAVRAVSTSGPDSDLRVLLVAQRDGSPLVRLAAAEVFAARGGPSAAEALGKLLGDPDRQVVEVAARGLARMPSSSRAKGDLLAAYADASPAGRAAIAEALETIGTSLREAVEVEARTLWERNLTALEGAPGAERAGAAEEVGASGRAEAVARLLPLVDPNRNPDRALAAAAARGLGEAGDWSARAHLEVLLGESDALLAEAAAAALGRLGDPGAADALAAAADDSNGRIAAAVTDALAALPQAPEVGVALCGVALHAPDAAVAAKAARHARLRDADCPDRPFLARLARPGAEPAVAAIAELGLEGAAAEAAAARLAPLLDPAREAGPRVAAAGALGRLGVQATAPAVSRRAAVLLARIGEARARWIPGGLSQAPAPGFAAGGEARLAAVLARAPGTAASGPAPVAARWVEPAAEPEARELGALLGALGRLRVPGAEGTLLPLVRDPSAAIRTGAVQGLAALRTDAAIAAASAGLEDPSAEVRVAAAVGLSALGPRAAPALARAAERAAGADPGWRAVLARALGDAGAAETVPALVALLDGPSASAAAGAMGRIGAPAAVAPLVEWLRRPGAVARAEAIEALAQLAARDAAPIIAEQLTSDRPEVRAAAARALGRLRHEPASPRLEALRADYSGRVRRAAVEALAKLPAGAPRVRP